MRTLTSIALVSLLAPAIALAQTTLVGNWHGTERNFPTVDLAINQNSGHAVFYLLKSNSDGSNEHIDGKADVPMENLHAQPNQLAFDVRHKDGTAVSFRVILEDANHAKLIRKEDGATFPLTRVTN
jgi:hypothetical protein